MDMLVIMVIITLADFCSTHSSGKVIFPENYDKSKRPLEDQSKIMEVFIDLYITKILDIDFRTSDMTLNVEVIIKWKDELIDILGEDGETIRLENFREMWTPDLYIYNLKELEIHTIDNSIPYLTLQKDSHGIVNIERSFEAELCITCEAQFDHFPFHSHDCFLEVTTYSMNNSTAWFKSTRSSLVNDLKSLDYHVTAELILGEDAYKQGIVDNSAFFSIVGIKFHLKHKWTKYIMLYYIPTTLIVITSWIFFLLPSTSYPARTALLVTVFLLLINIFSSIVRETPVSSTGGICIRNKGEYFK